MKSPISIYYIGYFIGYSDKDPIVLCVSDNKDYIKFYLKNIRGLEKSQYDIREMTLDESSVYSLYEDFILVKYIDEYPIMTIRDIDILNKEVSENIQHIENLYNDLADYHKTLLLIDGLTFDKKLINDTINTLEKQLTKVKLLRKISIAYINQSDITSTSITRYFKRCGYVEEERELTELFYRKMLDDKA